MFRDLFGNNINVGDFITYAVKIGNSPYMRIGIVLKVHNEFLKVMAGDATQSKWDKEKNIEYYSFDIGINPSRIYNQEKILLLDKNHIPVDVVNILEKYKKKVNYE